jgi:hypothetical protein
VVRTGGFDVTPKLSVHARGTIARVEARATATTSARASATTGLAVNYAIRPSHVQARRPHERRALRDDVPRNPTPNRLRLAIGSRAWWPVSSALQSCLYGLLEFLGSSEPVDCGLPRNRGTRGTRGTRRSALGALPSPLCYSERGAAEC